jgi:hypothetical protein
MAQHIQVHRTGIDPAQAGAEMPGSPGPGPATRLQRQ